MIYLDTHVVVWLYAGLINKFSATIQELMNANDLYISPIVRLELQYLYEINRITDGANIIVADLAQRIGLQICEKAFDKVILQSLALSWTRDPFDRLIVANAALNRDILLSKDEAILAHYTETRW